MAKSLAVAFFLWGTLGLLGAHHFYLGRDRHGIVQLVTLGGFVVGWIHDAFRMRHYVAWANSVGVYNGKFLERTKTRKKPSRPFHVDVAGSWLICSFCGLTESSIPEGFFPKSIEAFVIPLLMSLVVAYGVYFFGNIGETEGSFWSAAQGALLTTPYYMYFPEATRIWCLMVSDHTFGASKRFRSKPNNYGSKLQRLGSNALLVGIIVSLAASSLVHNCTITLQEDEAEVRCVDALRHIYLHAEDVMHQIRDSIPVVYNHVRYHGFGSVWEVLVSSTPEENAAQILGVSQNAPEDDIKAAFRRLARQYHPDRVRDLGERLSAERRFMDIGAAYELLSTTKSKRVRTNKKSLRVEL